MSDQMSRRRRAVAIAPWVGGVVAVLTVYGSGLSCVVLAVLGYTDKPIQVTLASAQVLVGVAGAIAAPLLGMSRWTGFWNFAWLWGTRYIWEQGQTVVLAANLAREEATSAQH